MGAATLRPMHERPDPEAAAAPPPVEPSDGPWTDGSVESIGRPDLDSLPVTGITRRRVAFVLASVLSAWIIIVFARQVGEATAASSTAQTLASQNAVLTADVAALQRELEKVGEKPYILQQARGYGLGSAKEIPFTMGSDAPALATDAPGSEVQRLGEKAERRSPLESWLAVLFGPDDH